MRSRQTLVVLALSVCCLFPVLSFASEDQQARIVDFKCYVTGSSLGPFDPPVIVLCLTDEDPNPFGTRIHEGEERSAQARRTRPLRHHTAPEQSIEARRTTESFSLQAPTP
jgi:hypothetical protein